MSEQPTPPKHPTVDTPDTTRADLEDLPPFLGSWRNIYTLVLAWLAFLVALFAVLTKLFS